MQNGEKGFEPVWCPFYREDSGRSIYCEGITADVRFGAGEAAADGDLLPDEKLREMRAIYGHQREVCG